MVIRGIKMMTGGAVPCKSVLLLPQSPVEMHPAPVSQAGTKTADPAFTQPAPLTGGLTPASGQDRLQ